MYNFNNPDAAPTLAKRPAIDPNHPMAAFLAATEMFGGGNYIDTATGKLVQQINNQGNGEGGVAGPTEGYVTYTPRAEGGYSQHGDSYDWYRPDGNYDHSANMKDASSSLDTWGPLIVGAFAGLGALAGGGFGGAASGAAGSGAGAVGSGAGFIGEGALSGIGAWDAALASAPSWSGAAAGGAGGFLGDMTAGGYGGLDAASAASMGGGGSLSGGVAAGSSIPNIGNLLKSGASSLFGGGSGGMDWTSLAGQGLNALGGMYASNQAGKAADAQAVAAREAQAMFKPWVDAGGWAIGRGATMLGKEGPEAAKAAFQVDPGYQWRLEQGEKGMQRAASAAGGLGSGKFLKDAMRFNQGEASQEFGNSFNRLMATAGMGQAATGSSADYRTQGANAQAAGAVGKANALTGAIGQGWSMYQNQQQQAQQNALMRSIFGG